MSEDIITRDSSEFKELRRNIIRAIQAVDILIDTHRPAIGSEVYLTSEEVCSLFSLSKRSLQNYRDNRQIPYTSIGGKILYPQSAIYKLLESHYVSTAADNICVRMIFEWPLPRRVFPNAPLSAVRIQDTPA